MWMDDWLSQCKVTGFSSKAPNSSNNLTNQVTSKYAEAIDLYLASIEDLETVTCFLDFQLTSAWPTKIEYLVIDLLVSGQELQSESKKACKTSYCGSALMSSTSNIL